MCINPSAKQGFLNQCWNISVKTSFFPRVFQDACLLQLFAQHQLKHRAQKLKSLVSKFVEQLALKKLRLDSTFCFLNGGKPLYSTLYYICFPQINYYVLLRRPTSHFFGALCLKDVSYLVNKIKLQANDPASHVHKRLRKYTRIYHFTRSAVGLQIII